MDLQYRLAFVTGTAFGLGFFSKPLPASPPRFLGNINFYRCPRVLENLQDYPECHFDPTIKKNKKKKKIYTAIKDFIADGVTRMGMFSLQWKNGMFALQWSFLQ